jgi:hypothetical protein
MYALFYHFFPLHVRFHLGKNDFLPPTSICKTAPTATLLLPAPMSICYAKLSFFFLFCPFLCRACSSGVYVLWSSFCILFCLLYLKMLHNISLFFLSIFVLLPLFFTADLFTRRWPQRASAFCSDPRDSICALLWFCCRCTYGGVWRTMKDKITTAPGARKEMAGHEPTVKPKCPCDLGHFESPKFSDSETYQ